MEDAANTAKSLRIRVKINAEEPSRPPPRRRRHRAPATPASRRRSGPTLLFVSGAVFFATATILSLRPDDPATSTPSATAASRGDEPPSVKTAALAPPSPMPREPAGQPPVEASLAAAEIHQLTEIQPAGLSPAATSEHPMPADEPDRTLHSPPSSPTRLPPADTPVTRSPDPDTTQPPQTAAPPIPDGTRPTPETTAMAHNDAPSRHIARAVLTSAVRNLQPVDELGQIISSNNQSIIRVYYFTDFRGLKGKTVEHRWKYRDKVVARVPFHITSNRWRAYSSKYLQAKMKGRWEVEVVSENGEILRRQPFVFD